MSAGATSVYRYYDKSGLLLYVGITARGTSRQREHNGDKAWWPFVATQEVEHFESRGQAMAREKRLIHQYRPPFNTQHNPDSESARALYLATAGTEIRFGPELSRVPSLPGSEALEVSAGRIPLRQIEAGASATFAASGEFRELIHHSWIPTSRVILLAPRKLGVLVQIDPYADHPMLTFQAEVGTIPVLRDVSMRIKVVSKRPFVSRMHEVVGTRVGVA